MPPLRMHAFSCCGASAMDNTGILEARRSRYNRCFGCWPDSKNHEPRSREMRRGALPRNIAIILHDDAEEFSTEQYPPTLWSSSAEVLCSLDLTPCKSFRAMLCQ